jgi:predicted nucleic acid-binding protein
MSIYVADASALLRYLDREAGFDRVAQLLKESARGKSELLVSAVNWGEIISVIYKAHGLSVAKSTSASMRALPMTIVSVDADQAETAGILKQDFKLPYADAIAGALALAKKGATLVTADFDFKPAAHAFKIEFLPTK